VAVGQAVKAGELLAQLEVREIQARLDQAVALRELAVLDLQRFTVLRQQQAVTQQEFEVVEAKHRVAQAAATEAETMLGYARVVAPFAGVIARKLAEVGDLALPGRALFELEDPTALRLEAEVPEAIIPRVQLGAKLPVRVATLADSLEGTVAEIAPTSDPNSRTLLVKLDLPPQPRLHGGQFGRVAVPLSQNAVLWAPASAIIQRGQMEILFVVTNQVARLRLVKTGKRLGQEVELLSGVENGESVVVEGAGRLVDGQPVTVR
jgi:RND family efflux transporter MFP subunit